MRTFVSVGISPAVYVDIPPPQPGHQNAACQRACVEHGLLTQEQARGLEFLPTVHPAKASVRWA